MAQGKSGKVVIEMNPRFKKVLHSTVRANGMTLKFWFMKEAQGFLRAKRVPVPTFPNNEVVGE